MSRPISPGVDLAWRIAVGETLHARQATIGPEQMLCGLTKLASIVDQIIETERPSRSSVETLRFEVDLLGRIFHRAGIDPTTLRRRLRSLVGRGEARHAENDPIHRSGSLKRTFGRADEIGDSFRAPSTHAVHLMQALLENVTPVLQQAVTEQGGAVDTLLQLVRQANGPGLPPLPDSAKGNTPPPPADDNDPLDKYGRDLTAAAANGELSPLIGRRDEMLNLVRILSRKGKANPALVGEAGVGKTAVVEGLAARIVEKNIDPDLWGCRIIELRMSLLLAGTRYRGDFEERMETLVRAAEADSKVILFLDELHTLVGDGGGEGASNILKPALARGKMRVIGATTFDEYRKHIEKDPALTRRFVNVVVDEPTEDEALAILRGLREGFERHHEAVVEDEALQAAISLSVRYMKDRRLPDKAIDLIDEACALATTPTLSYREGVTPATGGGTGESVTPRMVAQVVAERLNIPVADLSADEGERFLRLEANLRDQVIGQDRAVAQVSARLRMSAAGLRDESRPVGVFLFLGPTGVGKTYLAERIGAHLFGEARGIVRLDMSEYMERHTVARLVGSPPGYIGHDEPGQLTGALAKQPYSLVLLDEVEKAHPDVWDLFLQVFDDGRLTGGDGRTVDASHALFIMTSNLGASRGASAKAVGFLAKDETVDHDRPYRDALVDSFRPEFLNRIDEVVIFKPLNDEAAATLVRHELTRIGSRLQRRGVTLDADDKAVTALARVGVDAATGARGLRRRLEEMVAAPMSVALLRGEGDPGEVWRLTIKEGRLVIDQIPGKG